MARTLDLNSAVALDDQRFYDGKGYLDAKMQPVENIADLNDIKRANRFIGLTITVLDDGNGKGPQDYWLRESVTKWEKKTCNGKLDVIEGDDLEL